MKKEKIKLPFGLTIYAYELEDINKSSGNIRKFKVVELREGNELVNSFYKCYEKNGKPFEGSWGY